MEERNALLAAAQHLAHSQEHWTRAGPLYLGHRSAFGDGPLSQRGFHLQQRFRFSRSLQQPAGLFHGQRIEDEDRRERRNFRRRREGRRRRAGYWFDSRP